MFLASGKEKGVRGGWLPHIKLAWRQETTGRMAIMVGRDFDLNLA
jgi:hypothetical protein